MKRLFLTILGAVLMSIPALRAQNLDGIGLTVEKVNIDKLKAAAARSDAEIADAKKAAKAVTWIKRGEIFLDADSKPVNSLYAGLEEKLLVTTFGDAPSEKIDLGGTVYTMYTYEHFKAYVKDGRLEFWLPVTVVAPDALDKAYEAFAKAYSLDEKSAKKVSDGMGNVRNRSLEYGTAYYALKDFKAAADNFRRAYEASAHPSVNNIDTLSLFYAGFLGTIAQDYAVAIKDLDKAIALGYEADGEAYYYKFHCQYNLGDEVGAFETLKQAVVKYPNNDSIIEGLLTMYSASDEDPSNLIPIVLNAVQQNPNNPGLHLGLARVYDKLGQQDKAIESARTAAQLNPGDFLANYFEGYFIVKKGDQMESDLRNMTITSRAEYQAAQAEVDKVYMQAMAPLEKAYKINPGEIATVELIKNLSFRLKDTPGMETKFEQFDAIYKSIRGEE